jgi:hypothetical protein
VFAGIKVGGIDVGVVVQADSIKPETNIAEKI